MFELEDIGRPVAKIKVVGVGGGGSNAVNSMVAANIYGVEFITVNTDAQHLEASLAPVKVKIGAGLTKGLGAGSNPVVGRQAAIDDKDTLAGCIEGADMIFITAGMGGGTGTGASPVVASLAREMGILTVGVVTKPFYYEGRKRAINAEEGIRELKKHVDTLITIPNDRIHLVVEKGTPLLKSFSIANDVLRQAIQGISDLILIPGLINLDFADVKSIMENAGRAVIGVGSGKGDGGAFEAAKRAISNPLLEESSIDGAKGILINITGGLNMSIDAVQEASSLIYESADDEANIILGAVINPDMEDDVRVTVIATGLEDRVEKAELPQVKKWTPDKKPISLKGSDRILSKNIGMPRSEQKPLERIIHKEAVKEPEKTADNVGNAEPEQNLLEMLAKENEDQKPVLNESILPQEDIYDIPTFLRKKTGD
ncbi:MAG TPA: cell division protein FtsZ [Nitrospiraceae bacterium]|nr:MAG: cell division protein FtsZ [Nitrospirae bacterium GWA2_46_11]OGW23772.1 MAG: cell division protein FtsZ [Nitrospirae bacterium GWB2_47_37]HAK89369.1 cell division protein FtsZ [Nitrospiraceae bacterium]HCZ12467.1 cell division protein FtsZ [Nitrospiraceae bacterium]